MGRVVQDPMFELERRLAQIERRLAALERPAPTSIAFTDGTRVRVRIGLQDDGKYGVRVWTSAGALTYDQTTA